MSADPKLCFVQFLHPGREATVGSNSQYSWNTSQTHRRRFIKMPGESVSTLSARQPKAGMLEFWGEWEAEGNVSKIARQDQILSGPQFFCDPWYRPLRGDATLNRSCNSVGGCQNTDPFIFGDRFLYSNCQQYSKQRPNRLQLLAVGSVILFGSCKGKKFCLDTVLVIQDKMSYQLPQSYRDVESRTRREFMELTMDRLDHGKNRILYFGARHDERKSFGGMFSFVPCREYRDNSKGFARPEIDLPEAVSPEKIRGYRWKPERSFEENVELWNQVVKQVLEQGCHLGTSIDMPPRMIIGEE